MREPAIIHDRAPAPSPILRVHFGWLPLTPGCSAHEKSPGVAGAFLTFERSGSSGFRADLGIHVVVELLFFDAHPFVLPGEIVRPSIVNLLELRVPRRFLRVKVAGSLESGVQDGPRPVAQLRAGG